MKIIKVILIASLVALAAGCSRPKEIPDRQLESIFKDIFLANAYANNHSYQLLADSVNIYEPILRKYGYRPRDLVYTLGRFSSRKSMKLSDIVDNAIKQLDSEYKVFADRVAVLGHIDSVAIARYSDTVYTANSINVKTLRDTTRLRIDLPARAGTYKLSYTYKIDTTDHSSTLHSLLNINDSMGRVVASRVNWMRKGEKIKYDVGLDAPDNSHRLELLLGSYPKNSTALSLEVDSLTLIYFPPLQAARDSLTARMHYKLIIDGKRFGSEAPKDSLAFRIHPPGLAPRRDSLH